MHYWKWFIIFSLTWSSCSSDNRTAQNPGLKEGIDSLAAVQEEPQRQNSFPASDTLSFEAAFQNFFTALQAADTSALNRFIHPVHGLWVIEQPGAMPKMTFVTDITAFKREFQDRPFITVREEMKECDLKTEAWPNFDCGDMDYDAGKSGYSKDGCFVSGPGRFQKSGYWNYASLPESDIRKIESTLPLVQRSVLHTGTSFEFHFGYSDRQWRLLFAKLIYPCSA